MFRSSHTRSRPLPRARRFSPRAKRRDDQVRRQEDRAARHRMPETPCCGTKRAYATRTHAHAALARLRARFGDTVTLEVYHCRGCGAYHAGRPLGRAEAD